MSRYLKVLLTLRRWIDTQVPRDVLHVELRIEGKPILTVNHHEALLNVKMHGGCWHVPMDVHGCPVSLEFRSTFWNP